MLRLFLRLYLLLALGFAAAIFVVDHVIDAFYDSIVENYHRDAVRGQAYSLVEKLAPLDQAGRQRQLEDWRPHYGLELSLTDARQAKLTQEEQALLDKNLLVVREDFTEFISRIDAGPQLLDIKLPPEPPLTPLFTVLAYILLGVLVGIALLVWVRPHWRDLETLRLAAQRFGDGDLSSRTRIFRRSDIRTLAQHFNQMADRIESLISNQRELTNAVSHELRTPISRLSFELEQLNKQVDAEVRHDLIEDMRADLGELEEMVSELLTYARLEHGNVGSHREIVDAASWLDSVVADVALEAEAAGVTCEISACQVEQIRIEPRFMARAVINLLRNAIRHAHSRVEIALLDQGDSCQIRVNDDGPGIPADARQKIFEPFSRLDDSRDRSTGGFGLGLAIVRRVAQWHGGYAEALETPQGGASFRLTWERPR
ncbi:TPA: sensor histidine kinase ParS [Pseudomonas aeruginosa]|nr:sensor histidine kinase ParS [Pseudomonas aeruginosa]